jgi:hypothetical protein
VLSFELIERPDCASQPGHLAALPRSRISRTDVIGCEAQPCGANALGQEFEPWTKHELHIIFGCQAALL